MRKVRAAAAPSAQQCPASWFHGNPTSSSSGPKGQQHFEKCHLIQFFLGIFSSSKNTSSRIFLEKHNVLDLPNPHSSREKRPSS